MNASIPPLRDENGVRTRLSSESWAALEHSEVILDDIGDRLQYVVDVQRELDRIRRGKPFMIYGTAHWKTSAATIDMIIIDLASWLEGLWERGGFLRIIGTNEPAALAREWQWAEPNVIVANDDATLEERTSTIGPIRDHELRELKKARNARYATMFPDAADHSRDVPSHHDINELLIKELKLRFKAVIDDRNQHRAHKYEARICVTTNALPVKQVVSHLHLCQALFNDLRLLCSESSYGHTEVRDSTRSREARDIADLILFGEINHATVEMATYDPPTRGRYWEWRERYFAHLHEIHDRSDGAKTFNDRTLVPIANPEVW